MSSSESTPAVQLSTQPLADSFKLGVVTLSSPKTLNALTLEMIDPITAQLHEWKNDDAVVAIWLQGEGEKAFCAGGDIVKLYESMLENPKGPNAFAADFFGREYQLDYLLHTYDKPIICWGSGIVMGGGLGLLSGCSHRIVTETTRMAMPEITIGLFPDVGGTWFLNRMPGSSGLFLGLTGASINATDAIFTGLADYFVPAENKQSLLDEICSLPFGEDVDDNHLQIRNLMMSVSKEHKDSSPLGQVEPHMKTISALVKADNLAATIQAITTYQTDDKWLSRGITSLAKGCPVTAHLVNEQLHRGKTLPLNQVFQMELNMAMNCITRGDFQEGVRALLIDKDQSPQWRHSSVGEVPHEWVEGHFNFEWPKNSHPLTSL